MTREERNAYERERRRKLIEAGRCAMCAREPLIPGIAMCETCRERRRQWRQSESGQQSKANNAAAMRETRLEYLARGLCPDCYGQAKVLPGKTVCRACRDRRNAQYNARRREKVAAGLCGKCGQPRDREGAICSCCLKAHAERCARYHRRLKEAGICPVCGTKAVAGRTLCAECAAENNVRSREWYEARRERRVTCAHESWRVAPLKLVETDPDRGVKVRWRQWCACCHKSEIRTFWADLGRLAEFSAWIGRTP